MTNVEDTGVEENTAYAKNLQKFWDAVEAMNEAARAVQGDLPELVAWGDEFFEPGLFAALLMRATNEGKLDRQTKFFWLEVAEEMGPDYIKGFRHVGGFMAKVDEF